MSFLLYTQYATQDQLNAVLAVEFGLETHLFNSAVSQFKITISCCFAIKASQSIAFLYAASSSQILLTSKTLEKTSGNHQYLAISSIVIASKFAQAVSCSDILSINTTLVQIQSGAKV
ncbi:MAG: hypothetical protein ACOZBL_06160 [Patescibacteria group bacterium]